MTEEYYQRTQLYADAPPEPKHLFVVIGNQIANAGVRAQGGALLDVGGASGDLADYLAGRFPHASVSCLDADPELVRIGTERYPRCSFVLGDANDLGVLANGRFDHVTMSGVHSVFDDFTRSFNECIKATRDGGTTIIAGNFNAYPVDALVRWRYSGEEGPWNSGWNLFAQKSVEKHLEQHPRVVEFDWQKFELPFDLAPQGDPIRSWTEVDTHGNRLFKNGLQMEINLQLLTIRVGTPSK